MTASLSHVIQSYKVARKLSEGITYRKLITHQFQLEVEFVVLISCSEDGDVDIQLPNKTTRKIRDLPVVTGDDQAFVEKPGQEQFIWNVFSSGDSSRVANGNVNPYKSDSTSCFGIHLQHKSRCWDALHFAFYLPDELPLSLDRSLIELKYVEFQAIFNLGEPSDGISRRWFEKEFLTSNPSSSSSNQYY